MGKSTHPFVLKMNEAKAFHRAMRAGETKAPKDAVKSLEDSTVDRVEATVEADTKKRYVTLHRKTPTSVEPPKGVLAIVVPE